MNFWLLTWQHPTIHPAHGENKCRMAGNKCRMAANKCRMAGNQFTVQVSAPRNSPLRSCGSSVDAKATCARASSS
jgi:hypothetical protein